MTRRLFFILLGVTFFSLITGLILYFWLSSPALEIPEPLFEHMNADEVQSIEISTPRLLKESNGKPLVLKRNSEDYWMLDNENYYADYRKVRPFLDFLTLAHVVEKRFKRDVLKERFHILSVKEWSQKPISAQFSAKIRWVFKNKKEHTLILGSLSPIFKNARYGMLDSGFFLKTITPAILTDSSPYAVWLQRTIAPELIPQDFTNFGFSKGDNDDPKSWIYRGKMYASYEPFSRGNTATNIAYPFVTQYLFGSLQAWRVRKTPNLPKSKILYTVVAQTKQQIAIHLKYHLLPKAYSDKLKYKGISGFLTLRAESMNRGNKESLKSAKLLNQRWKERGYLISDDKTLIFIAKMAEQVIHKRLKNNPKFNSTFNLRHT